MSGIGRPFARQDITTPGFTIDPRASIMLVKEGCTGTTSLDQFDEQKLPPAVKWTEPLAMDSAPNPLPEGALPLLGLREGNFFVTPTIRQLAEEQGVEPLQSIRALGGVLSEEEADDFPYPRVIEDLLIE